MIIQRYIFRELGQKLAWILGLLVLIITSNKFARLLADAAEGDVPGDILLVVLGYKILALLPKILPITILLTTLIVFSRMANERELVILSTAGINRVLQLRILLRFVALFCILMMIVSLYLSPWAERNFRQMKQRVKQEADITGIKAGHFKEFSQGDRIIYVRDLSADKITMEKVFIQVRQHEQIGVLTSESASFEIDKNSDNEYVVFRDGRRYIVEPGALDYEITEYGKYGVLTKINKAVSPGNGVAGTPTRGLIGSDNRAHQAEFQWRLSLILSCFLLPLLALLLLQLHTGEKRYLPFIVSILIYIVYSNLLSIAKTLLNRDFVPISLGLWWVHFLMIMLLLLLYYWPDLRQKKVMTLFRRGRRR